jgi:hypothetical protein
VSPAAPKCQIGGGPVEVRENVDVGQIGADEERRGAQGGALPESAPRQAGADQRVADRVYAGLASSSAAAALVVMETPTNSTADS